MSSARFGKKIQNRENRKNPVAAIFLSGIIIGLVALSTWLWFENRELKNLNDVRPIVYSHAMKERSFLDGDISAAQGETEVFQAEKERLIASSSSFIEVNLKDMKISLYEKGAMKEEYPVKAKGKEGSWWETTTGIYSVEAKTVNHFSSISKVWMPYGIQFYGNFFIHGWPYDSNGTPIQSSSSGGCIRLDTADSEKVFSFAVRGMPVLVFEEKPKRALYEALRPEGEIAAMPDVSADAAIVADLDTGEILLEKDIDRTLPIGALTKSMLALTASEVVNLERVITAQSYMLSHEENDGLLLPGRQYRGFDLLSPILMQSSNDAARVMAGFLGESGMVSQMNKKAKALGMSNTVFTDVTGESEKNVSTLRDLSRLTQYILDKRRFIFGVSIGTKYPEQETIAFRSIANYNPFIEDPRILGVIGGRTDAVGFTVLTVWHFEKEGSPAPRNVLIGILGSNDANRDIMEIRSWFEREFGV